MSRAGITDEQLEQWTDRRWLAEKSHGEIVDLILDVCSLIQRFRMFYPEAQWYIVHRKKVWAVIFSFGMGAGVGIDDLREFIDARHRPAQVIQQVIEPESREKMLDEIERLKDRLER